MVAKGLLLLCAAMATTCFAACIDGPTGSCSANLVVPTGVTTTIAVPNPTKKFVAGITLDPAADILKIVESTGPG